MNSKTLEIESIDQNEEIKQPSKYLVVIFNDDFTSFEFVMIVLMNIFHKSLESAEKLTRQVHEDGEGVAGQNYSLEVARSKVEKVLKLAKVNNFPIKCEYREQK